MAYSKEFRRELVSLINRYSVENNSNTPDFIIAGYIIHCLEAYDMAAMANGMWHAEDEDLMPSEWETGRSLDG